VAAMNVTVASIAAALATQQSSIDAVVGFLGVIVPAWQTLTEVQQGDEMGMVRPSAEQLGLVADIIALQREPGFDHEAVVSMDPPAGTLVARGSTVHVRVNFQG
jgi:beta-lactam-binding protein with PASTA domain